MNLDKILNLALNKALIGKDRIKQVNSNEIADFVNKHLEAINYTHSCTELKDKKAMTFEEYLEDNDLSQTYIWLSRQGMTDSASKIHRDWQLTLDPNL